MALESSFCSTSESVLGCSECTAAAADAVVVDDDGVNITVVDDDDCCCCPRADDRDAESSIRSVVWLLWLTSIDEADEAEGDRPLVGPMAVECDPLMGRWWLSPPFTSLAPNQEKRGRAMGEMSSCRVSWLRAVGAKPAWQAAISLRQL